MNGLYGKERKSLYGKAKNSYVSVKFKIPKSPKPEGCIFCGSRGTVNTINRKLGSKEICFNCLTKLKADLKEV